MSAVEELSQQLESLAQETEGQAGTLESIKQGLEDQAGALNAQLDTSQTGSDVAEKFAAAITAVEDAIEQLNNAAQSANDYASTLRNS